jgi:hypothetical protein
MHWFMDWSLMTDSLFPMNEWYPEAKFSAALFAKLAIRPQWWAMGRYVLVGVAKVAA